MKKELFYLLVLLSFSLYPQNTTKDTIHTIIDNIKYKNLFLFEKAKNNQSASIKVFNNKNQIVNTKKQPKRDNIKIYPKPLTYNYTDYYSICPPKHITNIKHLKITTIGDLSKNQNKTTNNQTVIFIEKISDYSYNLWTMKVSYQE